MTYGPPCIRDTIVTRIAYIEDGSDYEEFCKKMNYYIDLSAVCIVSAAAGVIVGLAISSA